MDAITYLAGISKLSANRLRPFSVLFRLVSYQLRSNVTCHNTLGISAEQTKLFQCNSNLNFSSTSIRPNKAPVARPVPRMRNIGVTALSPQRAMVWPKVTLFGDSLTRRSFDPDAGCWASLLASKLGDYFDVDARGFSGYNSRLALELVPKLFPKSYLDHVEIFVLFFGHNDSWESRNPLHVPVDEYEKNMIAIVQYLKQQGVDRNKIIIITPNWYHLPSFIRRHIEQGYPVTEKENGLEGTTQYSDAVKRVARKEQIELVDAFEFSSKYEPVQELFCDGVHYSIKGAKLLFEHLWPVVDRKLSARFNKPTNELFHASPWTELPNVKPILEAYTEILKAEREVKEQQ